MRSDSTEFNIINFDLVEERRRELGLSMHEFGRLVGINDVTIAAYIGGASQAAIRTHTIVRLAQALQLDLAELLIRADLPVRAPAPDDVRLEAAILRSHRRRPLVDFERPLGMTPMQVRRAADQLEQRLAGTGAELRRHHGISIRARSSTLTRTEVRRLAERQTRRPRLGLHQARMLRQVMTSNIETLDYSGELLSGYLPTTLGYLLKNGYIREKDGCYQLTDAVAYSLGIGTRRRERRRPPESPGCQKTDAVR